MSADVSTAQAVDQAGDLAIHPWGQARPCVQGASRGRSQHAEIGVGAAVRARRDAVLRDCAKGEQVDFRLHVTERGRIPVR
jgi:hypothetical protein